MNKTNDKGKPAKIAYLDYSHIYAGAERVLSTIISNIDRSRFEPLLVFPYPMEHHARYDELDCRKFNLADGLKWWMGSDRWAHPLRGTDLLCRSVMGLRLAHLLKREGVEVLHVNLLRPDSLMWVLPAHKTGIKVIGHFRSQSITWIAPPAVQHCCDKIVCVSEYSLSRMLTKGEHTSSQVLYDSINTEAFQCPKTRAETKESLGFPRDAFLMSSIGQLSRHKGHDNAVKAFGRLAGCYPNLYLFVAGGGRKEDLDYLKSIASGFSDDVKRRLRFSEKQLSNINEVYKASDLILSLTKVGEAFGLVPYEATVSGTPFIAPSFGAVTEFIEDGVNGNLVDTNDVDAIVEKIEWILTHTEEAEAMVPLARKVIDSNLTPPVMCRRLESVYNQLLSK